MSNLPTATLDASWAEVRAHDQVMRYRRSGAGPTVLVLHSAEAVGETRSEASGPEPLWPELCAALPRRHRLIVPDVPSAATDVAAWVTDFLEGLGLARVSVVAADQFCIPTIELALLDREHVAQVVLVPHGRTGEAGLDGALATTASGASVPLLVVRRGLPADQALPRVIRFLAADGASAPD